MKQTLLIAKRELGSFFLSPIFYVITTVFLFIYSFIFFNMLSYFANLSFQAVQFQQRGQTLNLNEVVVEPTFMNMAVIMLLIIPIITMRTFAEEKKNKTFSLLLSAPVHLREIIAGKFLACLGVVGLMILLSSYSVIFLFMFGDPEPGPIVTGYLGMLLMCGCFISAGVFASSLTDNQIIAAVISFGFALFIWIIGWAGQIVGPGWGEVLSYLSLVEHLDHFLKGLIDTSDVVYYLSVIFFGLFLTHRVLDSRRWR